MVGLKNQEKEKCKQKLGLKCTNMQWLDGGPADRVLRATYLLLQISLAAFSNLTCTGNGVDKMA